MAQMILIFSDIDSINITTKTTTDHSSTTDSSSSSSVGYGQTFADSQLSAELCFPVI
jgi:hypothetical protein